MSGSEEVSDGGLGSADRAPRRLRVLHVIDSLRRGGAETLLGALVGALGETGKVDSWVCAATGDGADPDLLAQLRAAGAEVTLLDGRPMYDPRPPVEIARLARRHDADVVHSHLCVANVSSRVAARVLRRPHVTTIHTPPGAVMEDSRAWVLADGWTARLSRRLVAPSAEMADAFARHFHVDSRRIRVIPNAPAARPAGDGDRDAARLELAGASPARIVLCVARLQPEKGIHELLDAAAVLSQSVPDALIVVAGAGPIEDALRRRVLLEGLERVRLLGHRSDVGRLLAGADAFCLPSRHEGLPISLLEAMAAGLPCVATSVGGIPAMVAGDCALLVEPRDPAALAAALERVLTDSQLAHELGRRARERVRREYSLDTVAGHYADLYAEVAAEAGGR